jgi:hypothetical protein
MTLARRTILRSARPHRKSPAPKLGHGEAKLATDLIQTVDVTRDDWTLYDDTGHSLARISRYLYDVNAGRWFWAVLIAPDGRP